MKIEIFTDGGVSQFKKAAIGVVINFNNKTKTYSQKVNVLTNNEAEYQAIIFALKKVKQLIGREKAKKAEIIIKSDSQLTVNQLNGDYKIKEKNLIPFFIEIWNLKTEFKKINFVHIKRKENKLADKLVKELFDK